jgi:hypothetical protein
MQNVVAYFHLCQHVNIVLQYMYPFFEQSNMKVNHA